MSMFKPEVFNKLTVDQLHNLMDNARKRGNQEVWNMACKRIASLGGIDETDPLTRDVYGAVAAYEEVLTEQNGKRTMAGYIRPMLKEKGVLQTLESLMKKGEASTAHKILMERGMPELTFAYIVRQYRDRFSDHAATNADFLLLGA